MTAAPTPPSARARRATRSALALALLLVAGSALAGCFGNDPQAQSLATQASFLALWTAAAQDFQLNLNGAAPSGLRVVLTEQETGTTRTLNLSDLGAAADGSYRIPAPLALTPGRHYRLEAFDGATSLGVRELTASKDSPAERYPVQARGTFTFRMTMVNNSTHAPSDMTLHGTATVNASPTRTLMDLQGQGNANFTGGDGGIRMQLTIPEFRMAEDNGNTTTFLMRGDGTWRMRSGASDGNGTLTLRQELQGTGVKRDRAGRDHLSEIVKTTLDLRGTTNLEEQNAGFHMHNVSTLWTSRATEEPIWLKSNDTLTYVVAGHPVTQPHHYDGPAPKDEKAPSDAFSLNLTGLAPFPLAAGDTFELTGDDGLLARITVRDAGTRQVAGQALPLLEAKGAFTGGHTGQLALLVVRDGAFRGFPVELTQEHAKGNERVTLTLSLTSLTS